MQEFIFGPLKTLENRVELALLRAKGIHHAYRLEPPAPRPGEAPKITVAAEPEQALERIICTILEPEWVQIPLQPAGVEWDLLSWSYCQTWRAELPPFPEGALVRYRLEAYPVAGNEIIPVDGGQVFSYLVGDPEPPDWSREAIVYQVFPDRFHPRPGREWNQVHSLSDIYGGTLSGVIEKLDYIADLGFNCLWLNPFFPDKTHHGYHAEDYFQVNPRLGTLETVQELVAAAHARGLRVLLDFVANHWSYEHATFQAALADPDSDYVNWYIWKEYPDEYKTFFGVRELPQINLDYPAARNYMLKAADYWLRDMDFDGYRLDYAPGPSLDFWAEFRRVCKAARPDVWLFGEVVVPPVEQLPYAGRLDGCLDFALAQMFREVFAFGTRPVGDLDAFLHLHEQYFPLYFSRPSFLDNHDMNRFLWLAKGDQRKLKLAALCQFTLAGPPVVYYGTEVGLSQERDMVHEDGRHVMEECRQPMLWGADQDQALHQYYRELIHFRRAHPVLVYGERKTVHLDSPAGTYAYTRGSGRETILVALNLSAEPRQFEIEGEKFSLPPLSGDLRVL